MSAMALVYYNLIEKGLKTIDNIPSDIWKKEVEELKLIDSEHNQNNQ